MNTDVLKIGDKVIVRKKFKKDELEYTSQIQDIDGVKIRLLTPMYKSALIRIPEQTKVEVLVFGEGKVYELDAEVKELINDNNLHYTDIVVIGNIRKIERRYYFRVQTMKDILIREKNQENPEEFANALTIDLSGGGLQFSSTNDFSENSVIEIKMGIDDKEVLLEGEILSKSRQVELRSYRYTVKFLNLDNLVQEMIIRYVFKIQRENLGK